VNRAPRGGREPARRLTQSPLHRAKLRRPIPTEHYVHRPRLVGLLDEIVRCPVTMVVAPAGAGKTSLLSTWVAETSTRTAWLSVDDADRDVVQFWSGVIAALDSLAPGCGDRAATLLERPHRRTEAIDLLLEDLDAVDQADGVVVVDDIHLVDGDEAVAYSLARFLLHLPPWLHVVLVSRHDPVLPIQRMRSRGQLGELRFAELRFSPEEAVELLRRLDPGLSAAQIETAVVRADGWAASLHLAALAARSARARPDGLGAEPLDEVYVQDYVLRELLANEPLEVIEILHATAVVPRVNAGLAEALTGRSDAADLLRLAAERGLFLSRLGVGGWFGLHGLVRDVLTTDLQQHAPGDLAELHARAARWFEDADEVALALEQWLLAGRARDALRLLSAQHANLYDTGRENVIARTIGAIPSSVVTGDLDAMIEFAWCHVLVSRRRFLELVEELTWWVDRAPATDLARARVTMLQSDAATIRGRWIAGGALARQAMRQLGNGWRVDQLGRFAWNQIARELALSERWDDADDEVRDARLAVSRDAPRRLALEGTRAVGHALAGRPLDALRVSAGVRAVAAVADMTILRTELALADGVAHLEIGDRGRALLELRSLAAEPVETMLYCRVYAALELVQALLDGADTDGALQAFAVAEELIDGESFGADGRAWLARTGALLHLRLGELDQAAHWRQQLDDPFWAATIDARMHLASGDRHAAAAALDAAVPHSVRQRVVHGLLTARALAEWDEATKATAAAIELATYSGLLRTVASEGPEVMERVEHVAWRAPAGWMDRLRRAAAESSPAAELELPTVEPLTERERDVLRFLPSRLTIREIADELYVSVNTVKFHLRVIYRKLGVNSRAEAAEIARRMPSLRH
jgi:LuxR family maltose regulon positive regulatory protein